MNDVINVVIPLTNGTLAVGTVTKFAFWAPTDAVGGGITITRASFSSDLAIAAGSAPNYTLITTGTNGAVNGTVAAAIGSAAFTAGTPREATISSGFVDGAYGVAVVAAQTAANADSHVVKAHIQYVMGK